MKYTYYPGCSLEGTAKEFDISTRAVLGALGAQIEDLDDWTCCGANAAEPVSELLSLALPARNLALAEKMKDAGDVVVPCSACYLNLKKVEEKSRADGALQDRINHVRESENLKLQNRIKVRHILDVLANDITAGQIKAHSQKFLSGISVAPYYGCQCLRPYPVFDDPERPASMEPLISATGADIFEWDMGGRCCGASNMNTKPESAIKLVADILKAAKGADIIATVCPMCQMNLEAYQNQASKYMNESLDITVMYLPQLIGLCLGLNVKDLGIDLNLTVKKDVMDRIKA
ncbi:MAG: CoB--CoM heterodisulfide reductase iron-sulfur subunit B family protein [Deltaproteobacteria bacterium]|nr:CoB--CoM heterodisulfide reductase iron-sulfur subunit B family protein [Deltaproteobacteria bacterium]